MHEIFETFLYLFHAAFLCATNIPYIQDEQQKIKTVFGRKPKIFLHKDL